MKKNKIAIFHTEFYYSGGAEKLVFQQMDELMEAGLEVDCFSAFVDKKKCYPAIIKEYNIKQILPLFVNSLIPHDLHIVLTTILLPLFLAKFRKYDLLIGENQAGPIWTYLLHILIKKPFAVYQPYPATIAKPRGIDIGVNRTSGIVTVVLKIFRPLILFLDKKSHESAIMIMGNGINAQKALESIYKRPVKNCPPRVKISDPLEKNLKYRYNGSQLINGKEIKKPYILFTNRHMREKRLDWAIEVLALLYKRIKKEEIRLVITGAKNKYSEEIKRLAKELKVSKNVIYTGLVSELDLRNLYKFALVYIYTAPEEDFGMGIIEAMSYGVPVVAWNNAGPKYIVNSNTGFLVNVGRLDVFADSIYRLIKNKTLNYSFANNAYQEAKKYTNSVFSKLILSTVNKL